ncbi:SGNH/GDSL hydrolase family protein [Daejeonella lutea]|uniref:Lysophospholipase L1 n=1 Tax=Daejeonella lutea TaxID=572036 RepID=A0A1T5A6L9_9SPHI|nr:GDSL-type esterase/lipase family protein [Daejeonella lutea]SKB30570.1 Lysophospholipase L1 [Daejeonella lutea]
MIPNKTLFKLVLFLVVFLLDGLITTDSATAQDKKELLIVTFGNSTTAPRKGIEQVYAVRIHDLLNEAGIQNRVINSGIGGSHSGSVKDNDFTKIEHGMDRFEKAVLNHHPDWVTLNFGLNDAYQDKGEGTSSRIPVERYIENLNYFISRIKNDNGKVILLTPNPVGSKLPKFRYERLTQYQKAAKSIAKANRVYFIDSWKLFYRHTRKNPQSIDSLLPDGTHPNDEGHKLIAEAIARIIRKAER